jgi:CheY-like chemotaxis protein
MAAPATLNVASHRVPDRPTVLVVDDDETVRLLLVDYLADRYRVLEADSADAAVTVLRSNQADFILSDVRMPGSMDGFAFARWLRANRPGVPVLLTTGYAARHGARPADPDEPPVWSKPFKYGELLRHIHDVLHHHAGDA